MYSIFFNNRRLQFCQNDSLSHSHPDTVVESLDQYRSWEDLIDSFQAHNTVKHVLIPVEDPGESLAQVCNRFEIIQAAGGLVTNPSGDLLMIYRYGRWDLPKGKQERGESLQETALREVAEETGAQALQLVDEKYDKTYHCYNYCGNNVIKMTAWFKMTESSRANLSPQTEEGIEKVAWIPRGELESKLNGCFASIRLLIQKVLASEIVK
ncbi:MAG: NUDIX domain-containing protein [Bacteroidales bacterium]|jgi:8-oxo-dGTP pyrophosphatase MutT (NUDIX family)|nr:NUDIX domain-containing protein [Bacteroidales bacterium]NLK80455.1 NUDIX domain-containing protein [Bacteroidales bacterium]HKM30955.1 NUDIX domain-containing protein [Bacteroidales bacterium]HPX79732.1 NUDIX domain-containing protein [Bacteroidales bacterium]